MLSKSLSQTQSCESLCKSSKDKSLKLFKEITKYWYLVPTFKKKDWEKSGFTFHSISGALKKTTWWHQMTSNGWIFAEFLHETTHSGVEKLVAVLNQYWWESFRKKVEVIYRSCVKCQQHNTGKTIKMGHNQEPRSLGVFWILSDGFYSASTLREIWTYFNYCRSTFRLGWSSSLPKATALTVAKKLFDFVFPIQSRPTLMPND